LQKVGVAFGDVRNRPVTSHWAQFRHSQNRAKHPKTDTRSRYFYPCADNFSEFSGSMNVIAS
jgi:hypothetical protein